MYIGFGVDTTKDGFKFKTDSSLTLWETAKKALDLEEDYEEFCKDNELEPGEDAIESFIEEYQNDFTCAEGFEALLIDTLNKVAGTISTEFQYEDHCIVVPAGIPAGETEKEAMLTRKQITEVLAKHLNPLVEKPVVCEWLSIHTD